MICWFQMDVFMDAMTMGIVLIGCGIIGFLFAPLGLGGGLLFAPLLHYGLDWEIDGALLIVSLGLSATVSFGSGLRHRKEGHISDDSLKKCLWAAIPGAIVGVIIVVLIRDSFDPLFKGLSLIFITWAIIKTLRSKTISTEDAVETNIVAMRSGVASGGFLSSVLGIGAGAIYVPVLRTYGSLESRTAIGTSLHIMMIVLPISILTHFATLDSSQIDVLSSNFLLILCLIVVVPLAANLGARFGIANISEQRVMQFFVVVLFIIGLRYVLDISQELF